MHRLFVYPLVAVVALGGLLGGRWLELSGWLHVTIKRGGEAVGVPERVFEEPPGQPPPEAPRQPDLATTQPTPTGAATTTPLQTDTASPTETTATETETASPTETTATETETAIPTETTATETETATPTETTTPTASETET